MKKFCIKIQNVKLLILIFLLSLFLSCLTTNYDYDLFARLEVGEIFYKTGQILKHCPFSYTRTHVWYDHEWGAGVIFYTFLKFFGAFGLILLNALLLSVTAYFIQKKWGTMSVFSSALFLVILHYTHDDLIRCHTFTFFFFAVFIFLLDKYRRENTNLIWLLFPMSVVWNNLHGGVVSGLGIAFIYLVGLIIEKKPYKKLLASWIASISGLIINPYGLKYIAFLFYAATLKRYYILEWYDVFQAYHFLYYLPVLVVMFGMLAWRLYTDIKKRHLDYIEYAVLAVTLYMGLAHIKLLGLSLIAIFMYCSIPIWKKAEKITSAVILVMACLIPLYSPMIPRATFGIFPLKEVEFLKINNIKGNILVPFEMGSYVSYKLYPNNLIYMDGRYEEVYYPDTLEDLMDFCNKRGGWRKVLNKYDTDIVMVEKTDPAYGAMFEEESWKHLYTGSLCGIFLRTDKNIIHTELAPNEDINYYRRKIFENNLEEMTLEAIDD